MNKFKLFCGIDISKADIDVVYGSSASNRHVKLSNDLKGISQLLTLLQSLETDRSKILVCCENTGSYMDKLACVLKGEGIFLWAVHPLLLSYYSIEINRFKTDKADAQKIFTYSMRNQDKAVSFYMPLQVVREIRELFTCRKNLIETRTSYINRNEDRQQKASANTLVMEIQKQLLTVLNAYIQMLEKAIIAAISSDKRIKRMYTILLSIPCIGPVTAWHFLFITDCFERFDNWRTLASFIGTAPFPKKSGTSVKHKEKVSKKAYIPLKADLNQGIVSVCTRPGQLFYTVYQNMIKQNKPHLYILNMIKNTLLKLVFKLIHSDTEFNKEVFIKNKNSWHKYLVMS
ncbi:MAG: IS110 family transposase [Mucilaginibacter sp.]